MKHHPRTVQTSYDSPLGTIILAATPAGLSGAWFDDQRHLPAQLASSPAPAPALWPKDDNNPVLQAAVAQLRQYFAGQRRHFDLPLDMSGGTEFQQAVWQALLTIDAGETLSYGAVSQHIGRPTAVRAVGAAIGRNPVSIIVPCHRVLGGSGSLTGYAGGLHRKAALLNLEGGMPATTGGLL